MKAVNLDQKKAVFFRPRCKLWSCPECGQINAYRWVHAIVYGSMALITEGLPLSFTTVTSHEKLSREATIKVFPDGWRKLRKRLAREYDNLPYLVIPEQHQDGRLHVHGIMGAQVNERWLKDNARQCGLGYMAKSRPVSEIRNVADYSVKYLGKSLEFTNWAKGFHRVRATWNWPRQPERELPPGWTFTTIPDETALNLEVERLTDTGFWVAVLDHKTAWEFVEGLA